MSKRKSQSRETTKLSKRILKKLASTENLENSLSVGSKKRLRKYMRELAESKGTTGPLFDDKQLDLVLKYARYPSMVKDQLVYLNQVKDGEGYLFSRNLKIYNKIEDSLLHFSSPDHSSFRWNRNYQMVVQQMKEEFATYSLQPIQFNNDNDIKLALPKENTHSGYTYLLTGNKKKGDNLEGAYKRFITEREVARGLGSYDKPILIAFRTQASGEYEDDGSCTGKCKHKTRMVSMYDLISIINELQFSKPIQERLSQVNWYAGGKDSIEISSILSNARATYNRYYSIDFSSFDATISSWLIEDAFSIVRAGFKNLTQELERDFEIMVHDFIHKKFLLSEGLLKVDKGVPSGSMWTQIIDSIVNVIVVRTYYASRNAKSFQIAMGDDDCIFTNVEEDLSNIASYIMKNFGLIVKVDDKSAMGYTNNRAGIKFLSRFWRMDGQYRHPNQILSRLLFPERFRPYSEKAIDPALVLYAFILTYPLGMFELIDVHKFRRDYPDLNKEYVFSKVDSRFLPGSLAFIREYTRRTEVPKAV